MNKILMLGRLVRDVELRFVPNSGTAVAKFTIAVNRDFKKQGEPDADFFNCVCFGKIAENTAKYVNKGCRVLVEGNLKTGSYENKEGQKIYTTDIICNKVEFVDFMKEEAKTPTQENTQNDFNGFAEVDDSSDIPFW